MGRARTGLICVYSAQAPQYHRRASTYYNMHDYDHALADFYQAIQTDPKYALLTWFIVPERTGWWCRRH